MAGRGAFSKTILECTGAFSTLPKCQIEFLRRFGFDRYDIPGDGNCFYRALAKYYELSLLPGHPALPKDYHKELREIVVLKMCEDIDRVKDVLEINNNSNDPAAKAVAYQLALDDLRKDGRWNSDNADPVHEYAAIALDRRIRIFNKSESIPAQRIKLRRLDNGSFLYRNIPAQKAQIVCYIFNEGKRNMGTIDLLRVDDGHYELLYPKNPAARAAINDETNNVGVPTGPPPAPKALEAPRLATILAAKSPAERAIADNCLRPLPVPARRATVRKPPVARKASPIPTVTARKPRVKTLSRYDQNIYNAIAASLANTPAKVEAKEAPTPRRRPVVAPRPNAVNKLASALKAIQFSNNNTRKRSSSFENALKAIEEQKRAEALNIKRKEASIAAAAKKAEAAKIVAAKKAEEAVKKAAKKADATVAVLRKRPVVAPRRPSRSSSLEKAIKAIENANAKAKKKEESNNEASNNEKEALAFQRVLEESMMKFKIKNNKNK
jgi:hypothetical protein